MGDNTGIEWTDATWNPTTGCDQVSAGCDNCYAKTLAPRLKAMGSAHYQRDGDPATSGPGFGVSMHPDALDKPLRWTRPRRIFVNSMSDLFHQEISDSFIARVFAVMTVANQHTFQVLTKRHARMRALLNSDQFKAAVIDEVNQLRFAEPAIGTITWPIPNVWLGVSVEDQQWADIRIPVLADTPAAVRFLSMEPLLGQVCLTGEKGQGKIILGHGPGCQDSTLCMGCFNTTRGTVPRPDWWGVKEPIDWVIVGGESGPGARPMDLDWVRLLRDQCTGAGIPFFYKQQGSGDGGSKKRRDLDGRTWDEFPEPVIA